MFKICIVTYYGLKDVLKVVAEAFEHWGYVVVDFPLYRYAHDVHDKTDTYVEMFTDFIKMHKPTAVFWWCHSTRSIQDFEYLGDFIRDAGIKNILYNWDDPYCWNVMDVHMATKARYFDLVFTGCGGSIEKYQTQFLFGQHLEKAEKENKEKEKEEKEKEKKNEAFYLAPPFDPNIHKPFQQSFNQKYSCDVSMVVNATYGSSQVYPNQAINRKVAMLALSQHSLKHGYIFHIYGPEHLKAEFPHHYKGLASYQELPLIYSNSKINISTHVDSTQPQYLNERCVLVGACQGLLLVDAVDPKVFPLPPDTYISWDTRDPCGHVMDILKNIGMYNNHKKSLYNYCLDNFASLVFAKTIHRRLVAQLITHPGDYVFYNGILDPDNVIKTVSDARTHYLTFGSATLQKNEGYLVPGPLQHVPPSFSLEVYHSKNRDKSVKTFTTRDAAYAHWCMVGKHSGFKSGTALFFSGGGGGSRNLSQTSSTTTAQNGGDMLLAAELKSLPCADVHLLSSMKMIRDSSFTAEELQRNLEKFKTLCNMHLEDPFSFETVVKAQKVERKRREKGNKTKGYFSSIFPEQGAEDDLDVDNNNEDEEDEESRSKRLGAVVFRNSKMMQDIFQSFEFF